MYLLRYYYITGTIIETLEPRLLFLLFKKILKSLLNLLQYCFCCMLCFFGLEACGILAPLPGIEPVPPALEGEILGSGPPGKS